MSNGIRILDDEQFQEGSAIAPYQGAGGDSNLIAAETTRAMQEAQAGFVVAKQFPRDEQRAIERIVRSCQRPTLAEKAQYAFPRGGSQVTGPSIRLAEVLVQHWGNINFGYRELHEAPGMTQVLAYAYDLETNARAEKVFHVKHVRDTRQGPKEITDRRDLYELVANQASRRIRSCILQLIPGDVVEAALEAAAAALEKHEGKDIDERRKNAVKLFAEIDVTEEMIEKRMSKKIKALLPQDLVALRTIYQSLTNGMSSVEQWFPADAVDRAKEAVSKAAAKPAPKPKPAPKKKPEPEEPEKAPEPAPEPEPTPEPQEAAEAEEAPEEPQPEPETEDPEAAESGDATVEEMSEALTIESKPGRPSNFKKQLEDKMATGVAVLVESGLEEDDAVSVAVSDIYQLLTERYEVDHINDLPVNLRVSFMGALAEWSENPTVFDEDSDDE